MWTEFKCFGMKENGSNPDLEKSSKIQTVSRMSERTYLDSAELERWYVPRHLSYQEVPVLRDYPVISVPVPSFIFQVVFLSF